MFLRRVTLADVHAVIEQEDVIDANPDDRPYPSRLLLGYPGGRALHVVLADNRTEDETIVVTVYEPDPAEWHRGFRVRRRRGR